MAARAVVRRRGQITLPREVREALHVVEGDDIAFVVSDSSVIMLGLKSVPAEQAWFWSKEWQGGEREASQQLAGEEGTVYSDEDSFLASLA